LSDAVGSLHFYRTPDGGCDYEVCVLSGTFHVIRQPSPESQTATVPERIGDIVGGFLHGE